MIIGYGKPWSQKSTHNVYKAIVKAIDEISSDELEKAAENFPIHLIAVLQEKWRHTKNLI